MHVLVTGAAGHLGSHLVPALLGAGYRVTALDRLAPPVATAAEFVTLDLTAPTLPAVLAGVDLVIHAASIHPWKPYDDTQYLDSNIKGTWLLYAAAATAGVARVVLTSSIAAAGYHDVPPSAWPVTEEQQFALGDLYSVTKHAQEDIARHFTRRGVQTLALRPPAFMPLSPLETAFRLTACFALVADIVAAHLAAVRALANPTGLAPFEPVYVTNALPYTPADAALRGPNGDVRPLVEKHWPDHYEALLARGYPPTWLPAVYDLSKAKRLLGWTPTVNFEEAWARAESES